MLSVNENLTFDLFFFLNRIVVQIQKSGCGNSTFQHSMKVKPLTLFSAIPVKLFQRSCLYYKPNYQPIISFANFGVLRTTFFCKLLEVKR